MSIDNSEFSFRTRSQNLEAFQASSFDVLVIGGGITGAATARDAALRGLSVALVERNDFAYGTSSRSSKLIHGGLRYLQNFEMKLVFEALSERAHLMKTAPTLVLPLPFYLPVYETDKNGKGILSVGLWLYDLLALFRTPGFHRGLSKKKILKDIPFLKTDGLKGGFRYYDASMWDDMMTVDTLRSAQEAGARVVSRVEALSPIWNADYIAGFKAKDLESQREFEIRAKKVVVCAGPWTDQLGQRLSPDWKPWLAPSQGVHLVFDLKRVPVPGALVMSHPEDGRIAFVIGRPDFGNGVAIVGTTDGPSPKNPEDATVSKSDIHYLMDLLHRYFPTLNLTEADILSTYIGVRPLMGSNAQSLQQVSREHHIGEGPGRTLVVAGGKYTTHRTMASEIVDTLLDVWKRDATNHQGPEFPKKIHTADTRVPVNSNTTPASLAKVAQNSRVPQEIIPRYGLGSLGVMEWEEKLKAQGLSVAMDGFPLLGAQLAYAIKREMVIHLEDFYLRRIPLFLSRRDHGIPQLEALSKVWAYCLGATETQRLEEITRVQAEFAKRDAWRNS